VEGFVDVHSHVVPSGDDGAHSTEEAVELCGLALAGGTLVLFATPHAHAEWDHYPLTLERERLFDEAFPVVSRVVSAWGLDLRRGFEVFPTVLRDRDPHEFLLEGTRAVLLEFPGSWLDLEDDSSLVLEAADRLLAVELVPVIAHPDQPKSFCVPCPTKKPPTVRRKSNRPILTTRPPRRSQNESTSLIAQALFEWPADEIRDAEALADQVLMRVQRLMLGLPNL
jgi:Capsular polysaccharide synthesis, CpsB/CapC